MNARGNIAARWIPAKERNQKKFGFFFILNFSCDDSWLWQLHVSIKDVDLVFAESTTCSIYWRFLTSLAPSSLASEVMMLRALLAYPGAPYASSNEFPENSLLPPHRSNR